MSDKSDTANKNYEKITVNLPLVDIGKIDYLTDQGHYNSRAEFIRVAVKNELSSHRYEFETLSKNYQNEGTRKMTFVLGSYGVTRNYLERLLSEGEKVRIFVIGHIRFAKNIDVELVEKTIAAFKVYGIKRGPPGVIKYLESLKSTDI